MVKRTYRRRLLAVVVILMAVALNTGPAPGAAKCKCSPGTSLPIWTYYTDATKTVACGYFDVCWGDQQGCVTEFKTSRRALCCSGQ